jgi:hypothetical protein
MSLNVPSNIKPRLATVTRLALRFTNSGVRSVRKMRAHGLPISGQTEQVNRRAGRID